MNAIPDFYDVPPEDIRPVDLVEEWSDEVRLSLMGGALGRDLDGLEQRVESLLEEERHAQSLYERVLASRSLMPLPIKLLLGACVLIAVVVVSVVFAPSIERAFPVLFKKLITVPEVPEIESVRMVQQEINGLVHDLVYVGEENCDASVSDAECSELPVGLIEKIEPQSDKSVLFVQPWKKVGRHKYQRYVLDFDPVNHTYDPKREEIY